MPECTDAPAQSFGSKRPRKETGDVLANIQNANIRKATPGGNIDAVRFEGGSQESVAKRTRRTTRSQGKENPDAHVLVDLTGEEDVIDMTLDTSPAAETDDAAAEAADAAAEIPPETSGPDDAPAASTEETEAGSPGAPIQPPETWFCRDTNRWLPVRDVPFDTESQPSYLGYFLRIREKTDSPWRHAVVCDAHLQSEIDKNDADDVFERVEVPDGRYDLMFGVWRDAEAASRAKAPPTSCVDEPYALDELVKVGLAQWTGFDAAPDTLDVAKLGDDAKKLGARYPWVLKEHKRLEAAAREAAEKKRKRLEAAAREAAEKKRKRLEAAAMEADAMEAAAMEAAPREADAATDAAVPPPSTREEAAVPPAAIQGDSGPPVPPPPSASIARDEEDAAVNALFTLSEAATRGGRVRKPATPKAAAARDFAYNVLHAAGAEGMPVDSIVELGRRRGVYSGKKAKAEVVSRLTGQLSRDEAFVRVAPRVYARRDALNGDPAPSAAEAPAPPAAEAPAPPAAEAPAPPTADAPAPPAAEALDPAATALTLAADAPAPAAAAAAAAAAEQAMARDLAKLYHANFCRDPMRCSLREGCSIWKAAALHLATCKTDQCEQRYCAPAKRALNHLRECRDDVCAVCAPVRFLRRRNKEKVRATNALTGLAVANRDGELLGVIKQLCSRVISLEKSNATLEQSHAKLEGEYLAMQSTVLQQSLEASDDHEATLPSTLAE